MHADADLEPWWRRLREDVPELRLFDAHTHIGADDPDGFRCSPEQLAAALELAGARGVVFPMQEPAGYGPANDRVLAAARASEGRMVAFCRIDPGADPIPEAERCLDAGARGIKLHPRAERFGFDHPRIEPLYALAAERGVPLLVHAGRGIPALGRHVLELSDRHPGARTILAHAGISDLAWIWRRAPDHPNVLFDTAWWNAVDLVALFRLVPPGQILWASDTPYGTPRSSAVLALRCALEAGVDRERLAWIAGRQLERLLDGRPPVDLGPPPAAEAGAHHDLLLERVHDFLVVAIGRMIVGDGGEEPLALARLACEVGDEAPQTEVCRSVLALLDRHARLTGPGEGAPGEDEHPRFPGLHLIVLASAVARTPSVPLPADPEGADVAGRTP